jgi:hypothetical protein
VATKDQRVKIKDQRPELEYAHSLIFNPLIFDAHSISRSVSPPLTPSPLRILGLHRRVCNLISDRGDVIALVHPSVGNGPFHIVLARPVSFAGLKVGERGRWRGDSLLFERFAVDLAGAQAWDPALPRAPVSARAWGQLRERLPGGDMNRKGFGWLGSPGDESPGYRTAPDESGYDLALAERTQQGAEHLLAGLHAGRESDIARGTERLAGLGPGLTPAGDDFLLGFMARIWLEPALLPAGWTAPDLCQRIARIAAPRTTRLSRTWLTHAARGHFAESWHDLATALSSNDQSAIHHAAARILRTGATSGRDAMAGFLFTEGEVRAYLIPYAMSSVSPSKWVGVW